MKHPALTRVMAVVLAIVSLILGLASYNGLDEADQLREDDIATYEKLMERIALYEELSAKLEGIEEYKKANETLTEREEQHDSDASQHRTDVATHTATEGGYKTGADALWEAKAQLEEKSWAYYGGLQSYNEKKAEFDQLKTMVNGIPTLAANCTQASAQAAVTVPVDHPGDAPAEPTAPTAPIEPTAPTAPTVPTAPTQPTAPTPPTAPDRANYDTDEAYAGAQAAYEGAMVQYQGAVESYNAAMAQYQQDYAAYESAALAYPEQKAIYDAAMLEYAPKKAEYDAAMLEYAPKKAEYDAAKAQYDADKAAWDAANAAYQEYAGKVAGWTSCIQQGSGILAALGGQAPAFGADAMGLAAMGMALDQLYTSIQPTITEGEAGLAEAKKVLDQAKEALDKAENTIQGNLENIWYNMGKLEDEAVELNEEKESLAQQSARLEEERIELEEQKQNENKLRSTRILLMQNKPIAESVEAGGELVESSMAYAEEFKAEYEMLYEGRRFVCLLGIAAAVLGIIVLPAAYELIRSRFILIFPALLSMFGAAGCVWITYQLGEGAHYASIPALLFSFIYLLAAIPKKKKLVYRED